MKKSGRGIALLILILCIVIFFLAVSVGVIRCIIKGQYGASFMVVFGAVFVCIAVSVLISFVIRFVKLTTRSKKSDENNGYPGGENCMNEASFRQEGKDETVRKDAEGTSASFCPNCGAPVGKEFDYCPNCGKKLPD